jgi:hypothetical protein
MRMYLALKPGFDLILLSWQSPYCVQHAKSGKPFIP